MKKIMIAINLMIIMFIISSCGCSKKNTNERKITCTYSDDNVNDTFTMYFEDDIAKYFDSKKIYIFETEEEANEVATQFQNLDVNIEKNKISVESHYDYNDDDEVLKYDDIVDMYPEYNCK